MEARKTIIGSNILTFIGMIVLPLIYEAIDMSSINEQAGSYLGMLIVLILGIIAGAVGNNLDGMENRQRTVSGLIWIGIALIIIGLSISRIFSSMNIGIFGRLFTNILFQIIMAGPWIIAVFKKRMINVIKYETK